MQDSLKSGVSKAGSMQSERMKKGFGHPQLPASWSGQGLVDKEKRKLLRVDSDLCKQREKDERNRLPTQERNEGRNKKQQEGNIVVLAKRAS